MLCLKNFQKIGIGIFFSVLFSVLSYSSSYAISDLTYTFDFSSIPSWYDICSATDSCSSYSYMKVEPSNPSSCTNLSYFIVSGIISLNVPVSSCTSSIFPLSSPSHLYLTGGKSGNYTGNITIILTDSLVPNQPTGSITLSQNGTYDVSSYAEAIVDVPPEVLQGDYHDDLVSIKISILTCGAILLVLYFFYCIYRLIIKNSGVN